MGKTLYCGTLRLTCVSQEDYERYSPQVTIIEHARTIGDTLASFDADTIAEVLDVREGDEGYRDLWDQINVVEHWLHQLRPERACGYVGNMRFTLADRGTWDALVSIDDLCHLLVAEEA